MQDYLLWKDLSSGYAQPGTPLALSFLYGGHDLRALLGEIPDLEAQIFFD